LNPGEKNCLRLVFKWAEGAEGDGGLCAKLLSCFDAANIEAEQYEKWLSDTARGKTALHKAEAASCLNCTISNYKTADGFLGFFAGVHYQSPARTYYRDSFFTVLPLIKYRPVWVRHQLVTLAGGIGEDGSCPSAVKSKGVFWPNHLDSPMYFILLLHAYVELTGDDAFLDKRAGERTMIDWALFLADTLLSRTDASGLIYRKPGNRHDWADNVFREGYVCYEQALFCQSMRSMGKLLKRIDQNQSALYTKKGAAIAQAIESTLWLEDKGWYANYRSLDHLEDNLSIDTALLAWFGIARQDRARRMLSNMESLLETRNNAAQPFHDWGVMCCWPAYKYAHHLVEKSSYPYVYHNGSDWPFWSCVYALAKRRYGMDHDYPATRWFEYGLEKGWCTPVEYHNPVTGRGSLLQGWSAMGALALHPDACAWDKIWDPE
jgi:glycogen debranching enzyme